MAANFAKRAATSVKVEKPKVRAAGVNLFARTPPAVHKTPLKTRVYTKASARQDPMDFASFGFGRTGLTGES